MDWSPPGSSVHSISQARILEWVAILFSRGSSLPRGQTQVSCIEGRFFTIWATSALSPFRLTGFQTTNLCHEFFTLFIPVPTECTLDPNRVPVGIIPIFPRGGGKGCHLLHTERFFSHKVVFDSVIPWTVAHQAPLSMEFSRQEYWSGLPFPSPFRLVWAGELGKVVWN